MRFELLATAQDLRQWADTAVSKQRLPELIRRLCFATAKDPQRIEFPGASLHGYDGVVETRGSDVHVPQGRSVWELSSERNHRSKAQDDFEKRSAERGPFTLDDTTYVACVLRPWDQKEDTLANWKKKGWKDVRLYDCHSLEGWLHAAPAVHLWVSRLIGKAPVDAFDLETFWDNWSKATNPPLPMEIVLAGFEEQTEAFLSAIQQTGQVIRIRAEFAGLGLAFAAASVLATSGETIERIAARTVVVCNSSAWREITSQHHNLILFADFEDVGDVIGMAISNGHTVVQFLGREHKQDAGTLLLPGRHALTIRQAVKAFWPKSDEVNMVCERIAAGFFAFRRSIGLVSSMPKWAEPSIAEILLPAVLAGNWDEEFEKDREFLGGLAGRPYNEWLREIQPWIGISDSPIRKSGSIFSMTDRRDSWGWLGHRLGDTHLRDFQDRALALLGEVDPQWHPDETKRNAARLLADKSGASAHLKSGVADTLALLGAGLAEINIAGVLPGTSVGIFVTWQLLKNAADLHSLSSLSPFYRSLAEAAPEEFLEAIENRVLNEPEVVAGLFQDKDRDFFSSSSPHTDLLWALEILAWEPTLLSRVSLLLARLVSIDPGGRMGNRPGSSLRAVFLPWSPGTAAPLDDRIAVIDRMRKKVPQIAWQLMIAILPSDRQVSHLTSEARYRPWGRVFSPPALKVDVFRSAEEISGRLVEDAASTPSHWAELVTNFTRLHRSSHDAFFAGLSALVTTGDETIRVAAWKKTKELLSQHSSFLDAEWSLAEPLLERLRESEQELSPKDAATQWAWLFEQWVDIPEVRLDHEAWEKRLGELREQAIASILSKDELENFQSFALAISEPGVWGFAVGVSRGLYAEDLLLREWLSPQSDAPSLAARGYVAGRMKSRGEDFVEDLWSRYNTAEPPIVAGLLRCMGLSRLTLERLSNQGPEVRGSYWLEVAKMGGLFVEPDLVVPVVTELVRHNGFAAAIRTLSYLRGDSAGDVAPEIIVEVLNAALASPIAAEIPWGHLAYDLGQLLARTEEADESTQQQALLLEITFARLLSHTREPKLAQQVLAKDPDSYVLLIRSVFKDEEGNDPTEEESRIPAENAYEILRSVRPLPGQKDGDVSAETLLDWARDGYRLAKEYKRTRMFLNMFGQWLAKSPAGTDGNWPHEAVRELLEDFESDELETGMQIGIANSRGVYTKSLDEGGNQERALAARYKSWQKAVSAKWPRTSKVLGTVADLYEAQAIREDRDRG